MTTAALAGILCGSIIGLFLIGLAAFICLRRRRKRRYATALTEMEAHGQDASVRPYYTMPPPQSAFGQDFSSRSALNPIPSSHLAFPNPPPNAAYFSGIDTSDRLSVRDPRGPIPAHSGQQEDEEPPPPYRPRSVVASRSSSLRRQQMIGSAETNLVVYRIDDARSPFADPVEEEDGDDVDDAVSEMSAPAGDASVRREVAGDTFSVVSDLSYQQEFGEHRPRA